MTHIDDFIDNPLNKAYYAKWFFALFRFPAHLKLVFAPWMNPYELYCTWKGARWRVVGCSRMGPVWLKALTVAKPGTSEWKGTFYDHADVDVADCSEWSDKP